MWSVCAGLGDLQIPGSPGQYTFPLCRIETKKNRCLFCSVCSLCNQQNLFSSSWWTHHCWPVYDFLKCPGFSLIFFSKPSKSHRVWNSFGLVSRNFESSGLSGHTQLCLLGTHFSWFGDHSVTVLFGVWASIGFITNVPTLSHRNGEQVRLDILEPHQVSELKFSICTVINTHYQVPFYCALMEQIKMIFFLPRQREYVFK